MEAQQQQHNTMMGDDLGGGKLAATSFTRTQTNSGNNNSLVNNNGGRSSSTRWTPTTDQIRILKDLYYNNEVRSPTVEQIQRISARLRQYGKIEGKNVFYWFQNQKARERQKRRFNTTSTTNNNTAPAPLPPSSTVCKPSSLDSSTPHIHTAAAAAAAASKYSDINNNQNLIYPAGHNQMSGFGYAASVTMEKSFRDCSISTGGSSFGWAKGGMTDHHLSRHPYPHTPYAIYNQRKSINSDEYHQLLASSTSDHHEHGDNRGAEIETLPLFPMHGEDINYGFCHLNSAEADGWFNRDVGSGSRASLELSLNSYAGMDHT